MPLVAVRRAAEHRGLQPKRQAEVNSERQTDARTPKLPDYGVPIINPKKTHKYALHSDSRLAYLRRIVREVKKACRSSKTKRTT